LQQQEESAKALDHIMEKTLSSIGLNPGQSISISKPTVAASLASTAVDRSMSFADASPQSPSPPNRVASTPLSFDSEIRRE
jgi:hypothetical protein